MELELFVQHKKSRDKMNSNRHFHYLYELLFIREGNIKITIGDYHYNIKKPCIVFINMLENHTIELQEENYHRSIIHLSDKFLYDNIPILLMSLLKNRPQNFSHVLFCDEEDYHFFDNVFFSCLEEYNKNDAFYNISIRNRVLDLFIYLYRKYPLLFPDKNTTSTYQVITEIQNYIHNHLEYDLKLSDVADMYYINQFHLTRLFKKISGYTFKEYVILERIAKSKVLLANTDQNITEISSEVGFNYVTHFIKMFREKEGMTPHQYRLSRQKSTPIKSN